MVDIIGYATANPIVTIIVALVLVVALFIIAKRFGFDPKEVLQYIKEFIASLKSSGDNPTPGPTPDPTPDPIITPPGVEIKTADFFGRGVFTAAVMKPDVWESALGGHGKFEYRNWGDNEALYTILIVTKDGLVASSNCMYRLADNTVITVAGKGTDPFFPKNPKTVMEEYNEMRASATPYKYMFSEFGNRLDMKFIITFGPAVGMEKYALYQAGDPSVVGYVNNYMDMAMENAMKIPVEVQYEVCRDIFAVLFNYDV